ncbi:MULTISPECIES: biosynthetic arginine decarboxylase [Pseudoalteromonas]|uniref:Biosynthetic arginine decarboxylase n=1 Tax=Pseudoalteromonas amylolytica TaxID=1859457 RepID=A0A1S1MQT5_9GAMM|nr:MULTISPECIES: biosynthetic arginine decarboxylase [Pseudoalteromonas]MCF6437034.1 biosynthetic arginine decarboxylase [Pseudoalteromonas sp. MMG022]OHU85769.1 arginine decarboxylase [Pseudoalteromonas sp. JW3]OHU87329.1 arginine decarboxylase [Pseudoalteromonas amylolytica]
MAKNISSEHARDCYNVRHWSQGFYGINDQGEVTAMPKLTQPEHAVTLLSIAEQIKSQGYTLPALVRFPQILSQRVHSICDAFNQAISDYQYPEDYLLVYPIKVNQQREVVEGLIASQAGSNKKQLGLEAGSKAELLTVLAMSEQTSAVIVCNGYKDKEYVRLALLGEKLGHQVYIVLEKRSELDIVMEQAKALNVTPRLGLRVRLASQGKGKWQASGGEKSKFGLSASQVLAVIDQLAQAKLLSALQLVHFHLGSQMANIRDVRLGVSEAARFYCELRRLGANLQCLDVGGGLAVDYDGTRSQSHNSMNYSLAEYANNIVYTIGDTCKQYQQPMPRIISESGRALTAHHAVLITDVIGTESYQPEIVVAPEHDAPRLLHNMWSSWQALNGQRDDRALIEIYHDTQGDLAEVHSQFAMGLLNLEQRAWAEQINLRVCYELNQRMDNKNRFHRPIIDELSAKLADKFFVNFSLFQSLPDAWGIEQVFPVLPLSGLTAEPKKRAVLLDITCDSDGTVEHYVDGQGIESTLPVPEYHADQPYLLGFFLVGAYQEILGDMHNLFGDTHSVIATLDNDGVLHLSDVDVGDSVADMMRYVHLDVEQFKANYAKLVRSKLPKAEQAMCLAELEQGLDGYTYLEDV